MRCLSFERACRAVVSVGHVELTRKHMFQLLNLLYGFGAYCVPVCSCVHWPGGGTPPRLYDSVEG